MNGHAPPALSCLMPTRGRHALLPRAVAQFLAQTVADAELVIVSEDGVPASLDAALAGGRVRHVACPPGLTLGAKRNLACRAARGELLVHWDDDDWQSPSRLQRQAAALREPGVMVCGSARVYFRELDGERAWLYRYGGRRPWIYGATLAYRREFWLRHPFEDVAVGEDNRFVWRAHAGEVRDLDDPALCIAAVHRGNSSPKDTGNAWWQPVRLPAALDAALQGSAPQALVTAACGLGDILRVTPLVRVLHRLGHRVDVLLAPDQPDAGELLRGAPEVRDVFVAPGARAGRGRTPVPAVAQRRYDVATFTRWSAPMAGWVDASSMASFDEREWLARGDSACVEAIARSLGWTDALPAPFAVGSQRRFDLPPGTVALHPGCKPDWPWKKWHGFDELARLLPAVAIVGTPADLDNSRTYARRAFDWPAHARDFVGRLDLRDTAALLGQCAALVSNDSGLMHLGVALGVPTYGIFGITSPQREAMAAPSMHVVTKGLPCEPACRARPWGQRDCERRLECLKTLTAAEVAARLPAAVRGARAAPATARAKEDPMEQPIRLNYYGYVFDASGYGQAARAYIHALQAAGVRVSVIDMGARPRQVEDARVAAALECDPRADFHLFHGIPPQWAHLAYRLPNVIAMTVWETDAMPQRWRNPLTHASDVWLPCRFNAEVFGRDLRRTVFCLPHAIPAHGLNGAHHPQAEALLAGVRRDDFVFYGVFEWQERKNPLGTMHAFLRAFGGDDAAVLVLKTNPGAQAAAARALGEARAATGSDARVVLRCEAWSDEQLQALHHRGDCYVSLHRGEGWGYPLFEAACRGKPVVATAYSGPLDYLDADSHWLVRQRPTRVRQAYVYYQGDMNWAEPDLAHASEGLRHVYEHRDEARARAASAAAALRGRYAPEAVGALARERLAGLLQRANPARSRAAPRIERPRVPPPPLPIPGDWYDADYFEHGIKSNWDQGYAWPLFKGLFEATAAYLREMFPEARSVLDLGCAKGFLVRALREQGVAAWGIDHSPWAIAQADPQAAPWLRLASLDDAQPAEGVDVVTAFGVLESLTEAQVDRALARARGWTRQALLAVIARPPDAPAAQGGDDRDLSHVTLRPRSWWHERFLAAGWRQDALHRIVERRCCTHALPQRMHWDVHVYAP